MRRKLFSAVSLLSLLPFVVVAVLWVRSLMVADLIRIGLKPSKEVCILSQKGAVQVRIAVFALGNSGGLTHQTLNPADFLGVLLQDVPMEFASVFGQHHWAIKLNYNEGQFSGIHGSLAPDFKYWLLVVPYWVVLAPAAIISLRVVLRKRHFIKVGCGNCSYNLTGNVSGVCPECGTAVPAKAEARA